MQWKSKGTLHATYHGRRHMEWIRSDINKNNFLRLKKSTLSWRFRSSGMSRCVVGLVFLDVSKEQSAYISDDWEFREGKRTSLTAYRLNITDSILS
jgi:hypothetical protein